MNLEQLTIEVNKIISDIKDNGNFRKENDLIDYKQELNHFGSTNEIDIFFKNFIKDILAFTNNKGGIILIGFSEDKNTGEIKDIGLEEKDLNLLEKIDLNDINQKIDSITKCTIHIDLQEFKIGARKYYYLLIEKNNEITIPMKDNDEYKIKKGEIIHRIPGKNEVANENSQKLNRFLQLKANEKSKDFMEIWSKLLPEIFDINPKEILMINPKTNNIYGYNQKEKRLSSSEIDIDKSENGVFNIILNAISAGEIGKISDNEGKPLYKIVGEIKTLVSKPYITLTTLQNEVKEKVKYNFSNPQLKLAMKHLGWTNEEKFNIDHPPKNLLNDKYSDKIWIENQDNLKDRSKIVFSETAIEPLATLINDKGKHMEVFKKELNEKK